MDLVIVVVYLLASVAVVVAQLLVGHPLHLVLTIVSAAALMFRRFRPVAVVALLAVVETALLLLEPFASNTGLSLWFGLYAVAVRRTRAFSFITTAAVSLPLIIVFVFFFELPQDVPLPAGPERALAGVVTAVVVLLSNVIATGIGIGVRRDREHEGELRAWAERNARLASVSERNRIAREMHDVVAHSLTVMIALSDGAAVVVRRSPERAAEVLADLSQTGRMALADMRRVLGVLHQDSPPETAGRRPLPEHAGLEALFEGFRTAGLPLAVATTGPVLPADPAFALAVYRILQESLTNVLRYGRAVSRVQVQIVHLHPVVRLTVSDDGGGPLVAVASVGTGQGIIGMKERASIFSGTVSAGPGQAGGWRVDAVLKCPASGGTNGCAEVASATAAVRRAARPIRWPEWTGGSRCCWSTTSGCCGWVSG
ncbi:sensor histidine kinase [Paenarthrobacter sp. Z7-10]|uniref:sensor histidine kinase n=1 Tax=Paenarthrobacter sp. Z7-10 TaxID=2787635 RepID=UPI0022A98B8B|nr:histidine kinase [Paenarthrobacter sp. Z7-10]MCZ2401697.1 sensor histidine kinase [Paenarthrobacter sp. Z7-10]